MDYYITLTQLRKRLGYYLKLSNTDYVHVTRYGKEYVVLCPPVVLEYKKRIESRNSI